MTTNNIKNLSGNALINHQATKFLLVLSAFSLGQTLQYGNGFISETSILLLAASIALLLFGLIARKLPKKTFNQNHLYILLLLGLVWQLFQLLTESPGSDILEQNLERIWIFQLLIVLSGFFALTSLIPLKRIPQRIQQFAVILAFLSFLSAGIWVIKASPNPHIDVFVFQQTSGRALLQGENPYEQTIPNIYVKNSGLYGDELMEGDHLTIGNPYPPLSIYISTIGYIIGKDIRYSHLAAILLAAILIAYTQPNRDSLLISYLFLFTPRVFFVLEQSWTEPIVLLFTIFVVWSAIKKTTWLPYALGFMIASKQYYLFILPFLYFLKPPNTNWRKWIKPLLTTAATGLIVTGFLALRNISAFLWDVGFAQWYQPFRPDALSFAALYANVLHQYPPSYLPFLALLIAFLLAVHYLTPSPENFPLAISLGFIFFFAFNKQAFCNYYYLVIGIIFTAAAILPTISIAEQENEVTI